jgi:hypothetical protein
LNDVLDDGFEASLLLSVNDFTVTVYVPGAVPFALPPFCVFAVVVTVTVAVTDVLLEKSAVYLFTGSAVETTQLALGAVVVHENATRPEPLGFWTVTVVVLPLVAPATTETVPFGVIIGAGIADGTYWRT